MVIKLPERLSKESSVSEHDHINVQKTDVKSLDRKIVMCSYRLSALGVRDPREWCLAGGPRTLSPAHTEGSAPYTWSLNMSVVDPDVIWYSYSPTYLLYYER